jgi:hypothetical protein
MTMALKELARSIGQPDFYPFVMSAPVVAKLQFVHLVVRSARGSGSGMWNRACARAQALRDLRPASRPSRSRR